MPQLTELLVETYAFLDPASGTTQERRASQARSGLAVASVDALGRVFVLFTWADRVAAPDIIERCIELQLTYHPVVFGVEASGQQTLFIGALEHEFHKRGLPINLEYHHPPSHVEKIERIRHAIQPLSRAGRLFVQPEHTLLIEELHAFPTGVTVDLADALAGAISLIPLRKLTVHTRSEKLQRAIADYRQRAGLEPSPARAVQSEQRLWAARFDRFPTLSRKGY